VLVAQQAGDEFRGARIAVAVVQHLAFGLIGAESLGTNVDFLPAEFDPRFGSDHQVQEPICSLAKAAGDDTGMGLWFVTDDLEYRLALQATPASDVVQEQESPSEETAEAQAIEVDGHSVESSCPTPGRVCVAQLSKCHDVTRRSGRSARSSYSA